MLWTSYGSIVVWVQRLQFIHRTKERQGDGVIELPPVFFTSNLVTLYEALVLRRKILGPYHSLGKLNILID